MKRETALLAVAAVAAFAAGAQPWARLAWMAGAPELALPMLSDPRARGAALYQLGRYDEADEIFANEGTSATYNRGLTLAAKGEYALAVAYFDAVLFADRWDKEARHNRDVVASLVDPVVGEADGHGRIRALLAEAGVEVEAFDPTTPDATILSSEVGPERSSKRPVDERMAAADDAWLDTLSESAASYLRSRLAAELERRREAGTAAPEEASPW